MDKSTDNVISFEEYVQSIEESFQPTDFVDGSLALDLDYDFQEEEYYEDEVIENNIISFEEPKVKKLVIMKTEDKIFMGCWQGCNEDNEGDGC